MRSNYNSRLIIKTSLILIEETGCRVVSCRQMPHQVTHASHIRTKRIHKASKLSHLIPCKVYIRKFFLGKKRLTSAFLVEFEKRNVMWTKFRGRNRTWEFFNIHGEQAVYGFMWKFCKFKLYPYNCLDILIHQKFHNI